MKQRRQIVAMGGGGFSMEPENLALDDYILRLSSKKQPSVCFVATASGDSDNYTRRFYEAFTAKNCRPNHLSLFRRSVGDLSDYLGGQDIVYVGGGNVANMLAVWRLHGFDKALKNAYRAGVILAGISAGAMCWFQGGVTDSFGLELQPIKNGLGFLPGLFCPHYDSEAKRAPAFRKVIKASRRGGFAVDDGVALHFVDEKLVHVVSSRRKARAYRLDASARAMGLPVDYIGLASIPHERR
jgi:dipeptidase E